LARPPVLSAARVIVARRGSRSVAVVGHEVAQLLGGDVGALVRVPGGQDGRGAFGFWAHVV
jgi:hypothetical protein